MLNAELFGTASVSCLNLTAVKPDQPEPTGMFRLSSSKSFGEKQWVLLGLPSADCEERDLSGQSRAGREGSEAALGLQRS
jgi:hypothetical protein